MLIKEELLIVMFRQINFYRAKSGRDRPNKWPRSTVGPPLAFKQRFLVDVIQTLG